MTQRYSRSRYPWRVRQPTHVVVVAKWLDIDVIDYGCNGEALCMQLLYARTSATAGVSLLGLVSFVANVNRWWSPVA